MSARMLTGIALFCVYMTGIFLGNVFLLMMIGEVNRKRPDGNRISYFGFHLFKIARIFSECRGSYPEGKIHIYTLISVAAAFSTLVGVAACTRVIGG